MRLLTLAFVIALLGGCVQEAPDPLVASGPCAQHLGVDADHQLLVHVSVGGAEPNWNTMRGQVHWTLAGKTNTAKGTAFPETQCMRFEVGPADEIQGYITVDQPDREGCHYTVTIEGSHPGGLIETEGYGASGICT